MPQQTQQRQNHTQHSGGGGSEGVSGDDVVLSANEIKCTRISYGGIARRRSVG